MGVQKRGLFCPENPIPGTFSVGKTFWQLQLQNIWGNSTTPELFRGRFPSVRTIGDFNYRKSGSLFYPIIIPGIFSVGKKVELQLTEYLHDYTRILGNRRLLRAWYSR